MEITYRVFTWLVSGAGWLLLMLILAPVIVLNFEFWSFIIFPLLFGGLLFYSWKSKIKKDILSEPVCYSRGQSAFLWCGTLLILFSGVRLITFACNASNYLCGIKVDYLFIPMFFIAFGMTVFRPFKKHVNGSNFGLSGIIVGMLLFFISMFYNVSNYDYKGKNLPFGYEMPLAMQVRFFPDGAYNFEIKGKSMLFANSAQWSCNVSEKDFEKFCKKHGYNFVLNRTDVNEDEDVGPTHHFDNDWQKPYYFYNNRHANRGGLTMRYSVPEQKLYGSYSNR